MNVYTHNVIVLEFCLGLIVPPVIYPTQEHTVRVFLPSLYVGLYLLFFVCGIADDIILSSISAADSTG